MKPPFSGKHLGTIFNNDVGITFVLDEKTFTPADYLNVVDALLNLQPGVLAQSVGFPDPVTYPSRVATSFDKYLAEVDDLVWPGKDHSLHLRQNENQRKLFALGTDPLKLTIEACRKRGILILADFRMNGEDWYEYTYLLSDFGRTHPEWRIPRSDGTGYTGNLDPAIPQVYEHRMKIFTEVTENYDIDGLELDFRRWYHMVSNPLENHTVLTRMVRDIRRMLDEVANRKGRKKLLLGARVGPSLTCSDPNPFVFPGILYPYIKENGSCRDLGLDVSTWVHEGLVDFICPALFLDALPGMPLTREFVALAQNTDIGVYPTLWPNAAWQHGISERRVDLIPEDQKALALYKYDLCTTALNMYKDGADGISTFNWYSYYRDAKVPYLWTDGVGACGAGADAVQTYIYSLLRDPTALRDYLAQPWALPPK